MSEHQDEDSVTNELARLLNTRSYFSGQRCEYKHTIADYGLSDLMSSGSGLATAREELVRSVKTVISAYEPRLVDVQVNGSYLPNSPMAILIQVEAKLKSSRAPFAFKIPLSLCNSTS